MSDAREKMRRGLQWWREHDLAVMRIGLYGGLALHLLPTLFFYQENYAPDVFRLPSKNLHLYKLFPTLPDAFLLICAVALVVGIVAGLIGLWARFAATLTLFGTYVFLQGNAVNTQTLGMQASYGILLALLLSGAGSRRLSLAPAFGLARPRANAEVLGRWLIVTYILSSLFLAGVEKVLSGWVQDNTLYHYLSSPAGLLLRDWAAWFPLFEVRWLTGLGGFLVIAVELVAPILFFWRPARKWTVATLCLMLFGFTVTLQIPLIFPAVYLPALIVGLQLEQTSAKK